MSSIFQTPKDRRAFQIPYTPLEISLEAAGVVGLIFLVYTTVGNWDSLPPKIPTHFGASGRPDAWGSKGVLLLLPILGLVLYTGLTLLGRVPHIYNYPWKITNTNAQQQYRLARTLILWLKNSIVWMFAYIVLTTIQVTNGELNGLGMYFLPIFLLVIFGGIAAYFFLAWKSR